MLGTVLKHGVDVQVGPHGQRVFFGKTVDLIAKAAEMRRQEVVKRRGPPNVMERKLQRISVNAQENGVAKRNRDVSHLDWVNKQLYKRHLEV
ncbi:unnamed protein product [Adineta steineri]|uniref:Uncharacterized protein n=1 Tax=Adineta steineri TaxID=433720 RepID=A0A813UVT6_9BILA|nr:unnamed protein product [Adineta steineri]CAF0868814.1 unnamed protein product [Adineta steineri]